MNEQLFLWRKTRTHGKLFDRYHHCAPSDYDEWAKSEQDGASNWSYENMRPYEINYPVLRQLIFSIRYFNKFENYVPSKQHPDVDISVRGTSGPVQGTIYSFSHCAGLNVRALLKWAILAITPRYVPLSTTLV